MKRDKYRLQFCKDKNCTVLLDNAEKQLVDFTVKSLGKYPKYKKGEFLIIKKPSYV